MTTLLRAIIVAPFAVLWFGFTVAAVAIYWIGLLAAPKAWLTAPDVRG